MIRKHLITPYGFGSVIKTALICTLVITGGLLIMPSGLQIPIVAAALIFLLFTFYFYRDPDRVSPAENNLIVSPADGKVVLVRATSHPLTGESSTLVSIFMSPFNVHVNRIPLGGTIVHLNYHPGKFLMAFDERSMMNNERMEIGIDNGRFQVLFSQVSGFLARRIVCDLKMGEDVTLGRRFGMIKLGSRVDMIVPQTVSITAVTGMKTIAGRTVIGRY
jgi:phosphatidylserine decarboxylase